MKIWLDEYFTETKDAPAFKPPRKRTAKAEVQKRRTSKTAAASRINDDDRELLKSLIGG